MRVSNKDVPHLVGMRVPFQTYQGSVRAKLFASTNNYVVYSYGDHWPLCFYEDLTGTWYVNMDKYSSTTTRHLSLVRRGVGPDAVPLCVEDMKIVVLHGSPGLVMASNNNLKMEQLDDLPF